MRRRWSDNDHTWGPFLVSYSRRYRPLAIVLDSEDDEEYGGPKPERHSTALRLSAFGLTLIVYLPAFLKPKLTKVMAPSWDAETVKRLGRDWYWRAEERSFGFSCLDGHLQVFRGLRTDDSRTDRTWSCFLPWTQWRHVRHCLYDLDGNLFWTAPIEQSRLGGSWFEDLRRAEARVPKQMFRILDFDGEEIIATCHIEEREWRFGTGWCTWLSWFRRPRIKHYIDITYSKEVGPRKGSWKGGTMGESAEMTQGDTALTAFIRHCNKNGRDWKGFAFTNSPSQPVPVPPDVAALLMGAKDDRLLENDGNQKAEGAIRPGNSG